MEDTRAYEIEQRGQVATVKLFPLREVAEIEAADDIHWALAEALEKLRWDDSVRVIVLTGKKDGEFLVTPPVEHYGSPAQKRRMRAMRGGFSTSQGVTRTHQALAYMEKPVVARLNGDAIGFGQSVMFGCDLIVAREDAIISDVHLGMGTVTRSDDGTAVGTPYGLVPGDGVLAWLPALMPPQKAKEYIMLSRSLTAKEMAEMDIINYALPMNEIDAKTNEIVEELLARPANALAMTKRLLNRHLVEQMNQSLDLSAAYETLNFFELSRAKWKDSFRLTSGDEE